MAVAEREIATQTTASQPRERVYTVDEYLALEEAATERHEYVQGRLRLMSGGTNYHGALAMYLGSALIVALGARDCLVMSSDVKVRASGEMYYPDLSVTCGPCQYYSGNRRVITNPLLVAEVLSPSTAHVDRGEKFHNYLGVESLAVYLIVSQVEPRIEQFSRMNDGSWQYTQASGLEGVLDIPALSITLKLSYVYARIDFSDGASNE